MIFLSCAYLAKCKRTLIAVLEGSIDLANSISSMLISFEGKIAVSSGYFVNLLTVEAISLEFVTFPRVLNK